MSCGTGWSPASMWFSSETLIWARWPKYISTTILKMQKNHPRVTHLQTVISSCSNAFVLSDGECINNVVNVAIQNTLKVALLAESYCHSSNRSSLVFTSVLYPDLESGSALCWDPFPPLLVPKCAQLFSTTEAMQSCPTHYFLPKLCLEGFPGSPSRKGWRRVEVTCVLEVWEKWESSALQNRM